MCAPANQHGVRHNADIPVLKSRSRQGAVPRSSRGVQPPPLLALFSCCPIPCCAPPRGGAAHRKQAATFRMQLKARHGGHCATPWPPKLMVMRSPPTSHRWSNSWHEGSARLEPHFAGATRHALLYQKAKTTFVPSGRGNHAPAGQQTPLPRHQAGRSPAHLTTAARRRRLWDAMSPCTRPGSSHGGSAGGAAAAAAGTD